MADGAGHAFGLHVLLLVLVILLALLMRWQIAGRMAAATVIGGAAIVGGATKHRTGFPRSLAADCFVQQAADFPYVAKSAPKDGGLQPANVMFRNLKNAKPTVQKVHGYDVVQRTWPDDMRSTDGIGLHFSDEVRARCRFARRQSPISTWQSRRRELAAAADKLQQEHPRLSRDDALREAVYAAAPWCNFFNPAFCLWVYRELARKLGLEPGQVRIIDPSAGWGDRAIAACAFGARSYHGYDPNTAMARPYAAILDTFAPKDRKAEFRISIAPFAAVPGEQAHIVLTSPPYFDLEDYPEEGGEVARRSGGSYERWMANFFEQYLRDAWASVLPGGYLALYIENIKGANNRRIDLADDTALALRAMGAGRPVAMYGFQQLMAWDARGVHDHGPVRVMHVWQKAASADHTHTTPAS